MRRGWVVNTRLGCFTAGKETHYPLYQGLGWASRPGWMVQKILLQLRFEPQTIQPIESCYTDSAFLAAMCNWKYSFSYVIILNILYLSSTWRILLESISKISQSHCFPLLISFLCSYFITIEHFKSFCNVF